MGLASIPLFAALTEKMHWHQSRQGLLAENVANAETPGFRGRDLAAYSFKDQMTGLTTTATTSGHISVTSSGDEMFSARNAASFEITPEGNGVTLEDEMMKVAQNQMDFQTVTSLYSKSMRILKTALGKQ
jgi:flagellar basal-body rod protein FlgB